MRIIFLILFIFIFSLSTQAKENNNTLSKKEILILGLTKKEIVVIGLTLINPALSFGTIVANTSGF